MPSTSRKTQNRLAYSAPGQHLIDPVRCIRCEICASACPSEAITVIGNTLVVDPDRCEGAGPCLDLCPTGAIANWRDVGAAPYSIDVQAAWTALPSEHGGGADQP